MWKYSQLYEKFRKLAPSPQSFHLLAMVLLTGYFAENLSPPDTTNALHFLFPEVVENPKNQSAFTGSNVTFNCTVIGLPTPAISPELGKTPLHCGQILALFS